MKIFIGICFYFIISFQAICQQAPPQIEDYLSTDDDFENQIDDFSSDLDDFFINMGRDDYTVAYGIGSFTEDKNSNEYMTAVQIAYNQALFSAYYSMALEISNSGPIITTDSGDDIDYSRDYAKQKAIENCRSEAFSAHELFKKENEIKKQEQLEEDNSLLGVIKDRIKSDEKRAEEQVSKEKLSEKNKQDFVYKCKTSGDYQEFTETTTSNLSDVISGARVWVTPAIDNQIAVVIVKSNESSAIAGMLKNNRGINIVNPLRTVKKEIKNRIKDEVLSNTGFPESLLGIRAMKLSNGEWAVYAYGLSLNETNLGSTQKMADKSAKSVSMNRAFNALSKFSELMIDQTDITKEIEGSAIKYEILYNVTKDIPKVKIINNNSLATVAQVFSSSSSSLELPNPDDIYKRKITHNNSAYRLTAVAWSPSLASSNRGKRAENDLSQENPTSLDAAQKNKEETNKKKPKFLKQDW
jgi:hypothetical protein